MDILKKIKAEYLSEIYKNHINDLINDNLISFAQKIVDDNFKEYIKDNSLETDIKRAGLHYFVAIYLLIKSENIDNKINKEYLKTLVSEKNNILDFRKILPNYDFYLGSCGIEAQNLVLSKTI